MPLERPLSTSSRAKEMGDETRRQHGLSRISRVRAGRSRLYRRDLALAANQRACGLGERLELLLRSGAEQAADTIWLVHGDERHFSVLGSELDEKPRPAAESPWPVSDDDLRAHKLTSD